MKKMLMLVAVLVLLTGSVFAAVELQENGTRINKSEAINFIGPDVSGNGMVTDVDFGTIAVDMGITDGYSLDIGGATRTSVDGTGDVLIKNDVEADGNIYIDKSIYLTSGTAGFLFISQPDNGCSRCTVDAAGTTWACADVTCPPGM